MKSIAIITFEGMFDSSLSITLDILRSANQIATAQGEGSLGVDFGLYSASGEPVKTAGGLVINPRSALGDIKKVDVVILPGLGISDGEQLNRVLKQQDANQIIHFLRDQHRAGSTILGSCSASFFLAEAGIFSDSMATTSWWLADEFRRKYPSVKLQTEKMITTGKNYLCAGAAMAQADLMMVLVSSLYGTVVARQVANYLLIDQREFQSQYIMSGLLSHKYPEIEKAERWIRQHLSGTFSISDLAAAVGIGKRTLARRTQEAMGLSPLQFVQQIRVESAIHLLETTHKSFDVIAFELGYSDAATLRRLLQRHTGKSPAHFRLAHTVSSTSQH